MAWTLDAQDVPDLARGAAVLGTGGGGDPHIGALLATQAIATHGPVTVVEGNGDGGRGGVDREQEHRVRLSGPVLSTSPSRHRLMAAGGSGRVGGCSRPRRGRWLEAAVRKRIANTAIGRTTTPVEVPNSEPRPGPSPVRASVK